MGSPCYESPCKSGKSPWRSFCDGKAGEGPPSLRTLAPETRAQSGGDKSIFCLVKRMPASPDIRPSSLDSVQVGLGAGTKAASLLPDPDLIYRSSLEMKTKAQRGLGAGPRSHSTGVMWPLQTPRPPDLSPLLCSLVCFSSPGRCCHLQNWEVQYSRDVPLPPRQDLNAPDLYIPSESLIWAAGCGARWGGEWAGTCALRHQ